MKMKKPTRQRGRRRFRSKFPGKVGTPSRPIGEANPVIVINDRETLLKYLPADAPPVVPLNFAQTAYMTIGRKSRPELNRELSGNLNDAEMKLDNKLTAYQNLNDAEMIQRPTNSDELPIALLRQAMSTNAAWTLTTFSCVQKALARLFDVAWSGEAPANVEAKQQLESLIPKGRENPVTRFIPEIGEEFRTLRKWIRESDKKMKPDICEEKTRLNKLAYLYGESVPVIADALKPYGKPFEVNSKSENRFIAERLGAVLKIPVETARKVISKKRKNPL